MIRSMTGYGRAQTSIDECDITVELRSVNHRYYDCMVRIPRIYVSMEEHIKARVQREVSRGKIDVFVTIEHKEGSNIEIKYNPNVARAYVDALIDMSETLSLKSNIDLMWLSRMPEVFTTGTKETDDDIILEGILAALDEALEGLNTMRMREGENLKNDILEHAEAIERNACEIEKIAADALPEYREKLLARMQEVLGEAGIDENRILLEAAIYADKVGVDEELVRLRSHIGQLRDMLEQGGSIGRKLDFLIQEFNREINTVGSKANDIQIAGYVVEIKSEIEKIREQIQNIE
ncbi:MAG: YicC/YloC family endoribonuclease [Eubacteriales bacterium]|jgi:uncharacterized protein (TIGR00255 family)